MNGENTAAATLANEERAGRLPICFWNAQAAQKREADKMAQSKEVAQKDPGEDKVQQGMKAYQRWIARLDIAAEADQTPSTVPPASIQLGIKGGL